MAEKPVMYLDVDGVLWTVDDGGYSGALGLREFLEYALANYEVRWCTSWVTSGDMDRSSQQLLEEWTGEPLEVWEQVRPSLGWMEAKTECIDWGEVDAGRRFVWVEDELLERERSVLRERGIEDWFIYTNVLEDPEALLKTLSELRKRMAAPTEGGTDG